MTRNGQPVSPLPPCLDPSSVDATLSTTTVSQGEQSPFVSSKTTSQTHGEDLSFAPQASKPPLPTESEPLPKLHCDLGNQSQEQSEDCFPPVSQSASISYSPRSFACSSSFAPEGEEQKTESSTVNVSQPDPESIYPTVTVPQTNTLSHAVASCNLSPKISKSEKRWAEQVLLEEIVEPHAKDQEEESTQILEVSNPPVSLQTDNFTSSQIFQADTEKSTVSQKDEEVALPSLSSSKDEVVSMVTQDFSSQRNEQRHQQYSTEIISETKTISHADHAALKDPGDSSSPSTENWFGPLRETRSTLGPSNDGQEGGACSEDSCDWSLSAATHVGPTREDSMSHSLASHPYDGLPSVSDSQVTSLCINRGVKLEKQSEALSETSLSPENIAPVWSSPTVGSKPSLSAECKVTPSPVFTENTSEVRGNTEESQNRPCDSTWVKSDEASSHPDFHGTIFKNPSDNRPEAAKQLPFQPVRSLVRNLIFPSVLFLCGAIFFTVVLDEPSSLLICGLFLASVSLFLYQKGYNS